MLEPWRPDSLLEGFETLTLAVEATQLPEEGDEPLCATLVRRSDRRLRAHRRAIVHVHGWNDYFFHPHVAEFWENQGFAFHAVELRRYGRSLRPGQLRGYITDLADYADELDSALAVVRASHEAVVLAGHSTGGLTVSLYAAQRPGELAGLVLNSPWLDMWGPPALTSMLKPLLREWSKRAPTSVFPTPDSEENVYARAMHASYGGEWDYSFDLKTEDPEPIRVGWFRAVLQGHALVARGLDIDCPILVGTSARTSWLRRFSDEARAADIVLDVNRINAVAWRLGPEVTLARIEGGTHDLALSPAGSRARWFESVAKWVRAYVPPPLPLEE
ncbi:MAG TPA: alpha/beta hydrolase [Propionibacterium sp.]|nr:alpha/beta hydrolase [Propionibacterium sp.]